jgi:hypothetical protein
MEDLSQSFEPEEDDCCPDCGAPLIAEWSGVRCSRCP